MRGSDDEGTETTPTYMQEIMKMRERYSMNKPDHETFKSIMPMGSVVERDNLNNRFEEDFDILEVSPTKLANEFAKEGHTKWNHEFEQTDELEFQARESNLKSLESPGSKIPRHKLVVSS